MRDIFEAELTQLGQDLVAMSGRVEQAISNAGVALLTADIRLAESVIADDLAIDALEQDLDERCVRLLAQQQPVATDLRIVVSALRMSASLERMGDLARHVAQVARARYPVVAVPAGLEETFTQMQDAAVRVARRVTTLLGTRDMALAESIQQDDDLLDELHASTFTSMLSGPWDRSAQETVDVTLLGRYYERFGDHGVSVARRMVYLVTGDVADALDPAAVRGA
ncbi:phosphate signaling complex protein PhoU [Cellulomonas wangsupingiae]|uniref:Phosphate-specific transport system accessory protein PhoU n=1 Tax=Cellulomonas wangsupingiae TaxID=2968085 RepID=A0ABY5K5P5_9CELL|nr:phosphate signaling complex protein PhoU [Cellulomonas wangsupingiae]MCC2336534.1 phosphate signaling complex protein PhoU [Cellulomonas wangsupingiae]MCC2336567.1 phosphate signaling complex protein PhoU [Cellulomonas wangsupingiae]MCM0641203.1 phosphate signaling complex protein PhoU [Cellulomonas wangsupingiae]UUI65776.1 phosphate signaling complex protein PhoU [Cellulomonas wangsupingiae]